MLSYSLVFVEWRSIFSLQISALTNSLINISNIIQIWAQCSVKTSLYFFVGQHSAEFLFHICLQDLTPYLEILSLQILNVVKIKAIFCNSLASLKSVTK